MPITPVIVTTWRFGLAASKRGWEILSRGGTALDAVEAAANITELDPEVNSVGYGGLPNANGVVELDAAIMDGLTHGAGSVGGLQGIRTPISVARRVMEATPHTMLVGQNALAFALDQGFTQEDLLTPQSRSRWLEWRQQQTRARVAHFDLGPREGMGPPPTHPVKSLTPDDHDTIGLCALDSAGNMAAGCTTSGMAWKCAGRVGDSPIIGSGLYVDNEVGAAAGTGHGDEMMKACVSFVAVQAMQSGMKPQEACVHALRYLMRKRPPNVHGYYGAALIAVRKDGLIGAAATRSGFASPDRLWQWAVGAETPELRSGPYATDTEVVYSIDPN